MFEIKPQKINILQNKNYNGHSEIPNTFVSEKSIIDARPTFNNITNNDVTTRYNTRRKNEAINFNSKNGKSNAFHNSNSESTFSNNSDSDYGPAKYSHTEENGDESNNSDMEQSYNSTEAEENLNSIVNENHKTDKAKLTKAQIETLIVKHVCYKNEPKCKTCDKVYSNNYNLRKHIQLMHLELFLL